MTKVLVIDDEAPIRLLCRVNLEAEEMDVLEAADGPTGLEYARTEQPDVILLDVMMPGLDGWRVAEQLLVDPTTNGIPIIFLTARAEFRDRARGLDIGRLVLLRGLGGLGGTSFAAGGSSDVPPSPPTSCRRSPR